MVRGRDGSLSAVMCENATTPLATAPYVLLDSPRARALMRALARQVTAAARTWPRASTHPCRALATLRGQPAPTSALACPLPQRLSTPPLPSAARLSNPASQYSSGLLCAGPPASLSRAPRFPAGRWMTSHVTPVAGDAAANTEVQQVLSKTRVAVAQMTACNDTAKNFETVTQLAEVGVARPDT